MARPILETVNLSKRFSRRPQSALRYAAGDLWREVRSSAEPDSLRPGEFWALRGVDLRLDEGEVLGVIGPNGAGKSTLINLLAGVLRPTAGKVLLHTDRIVLMDYQGGLNHVQTGRENILTLLSLSGCESERLGQEAEAVIEYSDLGAFVDAPVGTYSLGMRLRLAFSIYTRLRPEVFIIDEALGGGDLRFRMKFQKFLKEYIADGGAILLCSHELFAVQSLCHRCIWLENGQVQAVGKTEDVIHLYQEKASAPLTTSDESGAGESPTFAEAAPEGVKFEQITLSTPDGGPLRPGGSLKVHMICHAAEAAPVIWSLEIGQGELFPLATMIGGYGEHQYNLTRGRNEFFGFIDHLPLMPGHYELRLTVAHRENAEVLAYKGFHDTPVPLEVQAHSHADKATNLIRYRKGPVHIPVKWQ